MLRESKRCLKTRRWLKTMMYFEATVVAAEKDVKAAGVDEVEIALAEDEATVEKAIDDHARGRAATEKQYVKVAGEDEKVVINQESS